MKVVWIPREQREKPLWIKGRRPWVVVGYLVERIRELERSV